VARMRWFMVGAAAAAGALVATPSAYQRLRALVAPIERPMLPPGDEQAYTPPPTAAAPPPPAAAFATYDAPPPADDDTAELRLRIDETRDRIRRRAQDAPAVDEA
jgi:hypothetical protein